MAAKLGGDDPYSNPRLRAEMEKALANNIPCDTIYRTIVRGIIGDGTPTLTWKVLFMKVMVLVAPL